MGTFKSGVVWSTVGLLAILFVVAAYGALDAYRFGEWRQLLISLALAPAFAAGALLMLRFAAQLSIANPWGGLSLGPGWECSVAPPEARVCFKDAPPAIDLPKAAPASPGG